MSQSKTAIEWSALPLGQVSDRELARRLGVPHDRVRTARTSLGIPAFGKYAAKAPLIDWDAQPLGKIPDESLARLLGVSQPTVTRHRIKRGILPAACAYLTVEGQGAASFGEAQIDLFWHEQGIPHEFQVRLGPYIADWVINGDTVVEFAGFADSSRWGEQYRERLGEKVKFYESEGWKVLVIYLSDLPNYTPANMPSLKEAA